MGLFVKTFCVAAVLVLLILVLQLPFDFKVAGLF